MGPYFLYLLDLSKGIPVMTISNAFPIVAHLRPKKVIFAHDAEGGGKRHQRVYSWRRASENEMLPAPTGIRAEESLACLNDAIFRILNPLQAEQLPSFAPVPGGECGFLNIHQRTVGTMDAPLILLIVHPSKKLGLPGPNNGPRLPLPLLLELDPPEAL